jgi:repressor LexA
VKKGVIEIIPGTSRGIRILESDLYSHHENELPIVGRVAAGNPILAEQHIDHFHHIDPNLFNPRAHYLLKVKGMSMRDAGILDGDLLAVHQTTQVRNGQVIVARLQDDVTVKRYYKKGKLVKLMAENPDFDPIMVDLNDQELNIEGLGVGVIRCGGKL